MVALPTGVDSDLALLKLTRNLFEHAGREMVVKTGSVMFEVSEGAHPGSTS